MRRLVLAAFAVLISAGCRNVSADDITSESDAPRLPTGVRLDPAGRITDAGSFPLAMVASPDGRRLVLLLNGYRDQGVEIVDRASGLVTQTLVQPAAFIGLVFSPDGKHLYASGGNEDAIYAYDWFDGRATLTDTLILAQKKPKEDGRRYPAGIGISPDGSTLYVAENLGDSLAVVDIATKRVTQRLATERYPYGIAVSADGIVYVSAWGGSTVAVFTPSGKSLIAVVRIPVARHPSAILLNADGSRLFAVSASTDAISVVDTHEKQTIGTISVANPGGPREGTTPNALALSPDGKRLYVAEADNNAVAIIDLSAKASAVPTATGNDAVAGRIPAGWYPSSLAVTRDSLFVVNGKGRGTHRSFSFHDGSPRTITRWPSGSGSSIVSSLMPR